MSNGNCAAFNFAEISVADAQLLGCFVLFDTLADPHALEVIRVYLLHCLATFAEAYCFTTDGFDFFTACTDVTVEPGFFVSKHVIWFLLWFEQND